MSQDVQLIASEAGLYDLVLTEGGRDLASVDGMENFFSVSMFTDARATADQIPQANKRRGFVGDLLSPNEPFAESLFWTLEQSRLTQKTVNLALLYTIQATQWLIDRGIVTSIDVNLAFEEGGKFVIIADVSEIDLAGRKIFLTVRVERPDGQIDRYAAIWRNTDASAIS